jgi:hypothetical protein
MLSVNQWYSGVSGIRGRTLNQDEEPALVVFNLVELVSRQAKRLAELARAAVKVPAELL